MKWYVTYPIINCLFFYCNQHTIISILLVGTLLHFVCISILYITFNYYTMKGLKRESNIHLRISEQEKLKYSRVADQIGLSLSAFLRYSADKATRLVKNNEDEIA